MRICYVWKYFFHWAYNQKTSGKPVYMFAHMGVARLVQLSVVCNFLKRTFDDMDFVFSNQTDPDPA